MRPQRSAQGRAMSRSWLLTRSPRWTKSSFATPARRSPQIARRKLFLCPPRLPERARTVPAVRPPSPRTVASWSLRPTPPIWSRETTTASLIFFCATRALARRRAVLPPHRSFRSRPMEAPRTRPAALRPSAPTGASLLSSQRRRIFCPRQRRRVPFQVRRPISYRMIPLQRFPPPHSCAIRALAPLSPARPLPGH